MGTLSDRRSGASKEPLSVTPRKISGVEFHATQQLCSQLVVLVNAEVGGKESEGTSENGMKKFTDPTLGFPLHA